MSSWKSYGGINNYENTNNITVDHLSANYFTLKNEYVGYFSICGELSVTDDTYLRSNVFVGGNHVISRESVVNGNSFNKKNVDIRGNLGVGKDVDISGDTLMWGNLHLMQNYELEGNLMVNGNMIQMGLVNRNPKTYNINLSSLDKKLGFNNSTPTHTFDIKTDQIDGFSIKSDKPTNNNIIAQNNSNKGIVVKTGDSTSSLNFFNDNSIQNGIISDASITYSIGGNLVVKNSNNTLLNSKVSVSNRNEGNHSSHNETVVIYDISSGKYLYDVYENTVFSTGSALSLITDSSYSSTGLNIMTPTGKGIKIIGGAEITDINRSSGIIGMLDVSNNLVPSLSMISGISKVKKRSSIGINKCTPSVDNYVFDVNGPIKISHSEIVMVSNTKYEIKKVVFSKTNKQNGFAFGSPVSTIINLQYSYKQVLLYTHDGGKSWKETEYTSSSPLSSKSSVLHTGCTSGNNVGFVAGENSLLLYSTDAFVTWKVITYSLPTVISVIDITNINIYSETTVASTVHTLYIFYTSINIIATNKQQIGYFTFTSLAENDLMATQTFNTYYSFLLGGLPNILRTNASYIDSTHILIAGETGIGRLLKGVNNSAPTLTTISPLQNWKYNGMSQFGDTVIAVGNVISVSNDRGVNWNNIPTTAIFNDVYVNSLTTAIAVGNDGAVYSTINAGVSWNIDNGVINNSGVGNLILNPNRNLASINMTDNNTFIISSTVVPYSIVNNIPQPSESKIYCCHFPEIFDSINNNVLDVCGNMRLSGDSSVYGNSYVSKTITANKVKTEFIDYIGDTISIGTLSGGKTIRISDAVTATYSLPNNIFIGGRHDNVVIEGNNVSVIGTIATQQATIQLLKGVTGGIGATSAGAGINIRDFDDDLSAFIHVNQNLDGFVFKSSKIHPNVLNMRVDDLSIRGRLDSINNQQIQNGIVILRDVADNNAGMVTTMTTAWFDAKNVLLRDYTYSGVTPNQQTVTTDFGVSENVYFYKKLNVSQDVKINGTLSPKILDVLTNSLLRGIVVLSNTSESSLEVNGGGKFYGNLKLYGNLSMGSGSTTIEGNLYQNSRTFLTGDFDAYDTTSGALQITGGVSTKGNVFIGNNLNVTGNSTFNKKVNITNTIDATDYLSGSFIVDGGASIKKNVFILGNLEIKNGLRVKDTTDVTGINTASVILSGGCIVSKQLYCDGNIITNGNLSVYNDAVIGTRNLITIIPLPTPFIASSITAPGQTISGGNYIISAGPSLDNLYYNSFNTTGLGYWSGSGYVATGLPVTTSIQTNIDNVNVSGNFLQIKLPSRVIITSYTLDSVNSRYPESWIVCGSNDGTNFISLDTNIVPTLSFPATFYRKLSSCNKSFSYYRLVVTKMVPGGFGSVVVSKFYLNGFLEKESDNSIISIGSTSVIGNIVISGSSKINDETESTNQLSGALVVSGGIGVSGNAFMRDINIRNGNVTNNLIVKTFLGIGGVLSSTHTLDVNGSTNISGPLSVSGTISVGGQFSLGNIILTERIETTQLGRGTLISNGGASIAGNLFTGGNIVSNYNLTVSGNTNVNGTLQSNIRSNGIVVENGGNLTIESGGNFICRGTLNIAQSILTSDIQSDDVFSGSLIIKGGAGISANVNVGGNLKVAGCTILSTFTCSGNSMTNGIAFYGNLIDSVRLSSGSLQVSGGSSIMGNIYVGGNIILSRQILVRPNISSNTIGEGSLIVVGGASISENCNIGGNTIIYGSTNNIPTIFFPPSTPPTTTLFTAVPVTTSVSVVTGSSTTVNQQTTLTLSGQTNVDSYQNGTYYITTGSNAYQDYYGYYAIIGGYTKPWISGRSYDNISGIPISNLPSDTIVYTSPGLNNVETNTTGEWIQYSLPYSLTLTSYSLKLEKNNGPATIEAYPISWVVAGSTDGSRWTLISRLDNQPTTTPAVPKIFSLGSTIGYSHFRFITIKVKITTLITAGAGICASGLHNISFNGIPSISPFTTPVPNQVPSVNPTVPVDPTTNTITYNNNIAGSSIMNSLIGANTFAGKSSLVVFGDSTVYGTHNVFANLNIIGNINNPTNLLNINSNVYVNGNFGITGSITGATGSFSDIICSNILTGATGSFNYLNVGTGYIENISSTGVITGATGSFNYLNLGTGYIENISSTGVITGATGSFNYLNLGTGYIENISSTGVITGATGSFNYLNVGTGYINNISSTGVITGATGSFNYLNVGTGYINNISSTGVITGATGSFKFLAAGQITSTGPVTAPTFTTTSDYRIKGNVHTLDNSFSVDKLRPVSYLNELTNNQDIGLIAHELQEQYPFLVHGEKDGTERQSVNYTGIIGILISEIKSLKKRVSILEEQ
jgi:hypothetical protein